MHLIPIEEDDFQLHEDNNLLHMGDQNKEDIIMNEGNLGGDNTNQTDAAISQSTGKIGSSVRGWKRARNAEGRNSKSMARTGGIVIQEPMKSFSDALPVKAALRKRGMFVDGICQSCGEEIETNEHLFFHCRRAKEVWNLAPIQWELPKDPNIKFRSWWAAACGPPRMIVRGSPPPGAAACGRRGCGLHTCSCSTQMVVATARGVAASGSLAIAGRWVDVHGYCYGTPARMGCCADKGSSHEAAIRLSVARVRTGAGLMRLLQFTSASRWRFLSRWGERSGLLRWVFGREFWC
ncbi:RNA-directed DNA polymerase (reversetranscriptase)-related family protein [Striga asiatica]|uniref:RNA-directed DNA polymerase (Reversetranscriptase)-related family protein n=1 Tax=Striga asiatica TaxID=4170 RepID=A0A5A7PAB2_STRAF|nr:RNA-directed DNA polymerase (reversetranscriptase)-related family protein [Striga asiatica]